MSVQRSKSAMEQIAHRRSSTPENTADSSMPCQGRDATSHADTASLPADCDGPPAHDCGASEDRQWSSCSCSDRSSRKTFHQSEGADRPAAVPRRHSDSVHHMQAYSFALLAMTLCSLLLGTPVQGARSIGAPSADPQVHLHIL